MLADMETIEARTPAEYTAQTGLAGDDPHSLLAGSQIGYFPGSTRKLGALAGEMDPTRGGIATASRTESRFGLVTFDWASSFEHKVGGQSRTYFLLADAVPTSALIPYQPGTFDGITKPYPKVPFPACGPYHCLADDLLAWTTSPDPASLVLQTDQDLGATPPKSYFRACAPGQICDAPVAPLSGVSM